MKRFKKFIVSEEKSVSHDMTYVRGNPFHEMHASLANHVKSSGEEHKGGHSVILSGSHDKLKNPLTPEQKLKHAKRAFPGVNVSVADKKSPTILHHASDLHKKGVTDLHVHVGSDRVKEFHDLLHKYNGKESKHGHYNFKSIHVHSFGDERSEDEKGKSSYSATKMRAAAAANDKKTFHGMAPSAMSTKHKDEMMKDVQKGLQEAIQESCHATTTASVAGIGDGGINGVDTNALAQDDVNANFMGTINKNANMHSKINFSNTYKPGKTGGRGGGPAAARAFANGKKRKQDH